MSRVSASLLLLLAWLLSSCVSAPSVEPIPSAVRAAQTDATSERRPTETQWWQPLADDSLHQLINQGLTQSPTPAIALARLKQAQQSIKIAAADRWPEIQVLGSQSGQRFNNDNLDTTRSEAGTLGLAWSAGLWGKRQLQIQRAQQAYQQRWFEVQAARLALSASIAELYFQLVEYGLQEQLLTLQRTTSRELEQLIEARFRLGQAPASSLYQQREATAALHQRLLENSTEQAALEEALDVLLGEVPDQKPRVNRSTLPGVPALTDGTRPADLIRHRADLRAGYARLQQVASEAGLAFAERLPSLSVTANLSSLNQKQLSQQWFGWVIDLAVPLFTGGRLRGIEQEALAVLEEERQRYLALWLGALQEVHTLVLRHQQQLQIISSLEARLDYARQALQAARQRYVLGDQNYLDVLTALRGLQETERLLITARRQSLTLWIRVMEAIGQRQTCVDEAACRLS